MVTYAPLALEASSTCSSLAMVMFNHAYNHINICVGFSEVNLKPTQFALQKIITWIKKFDKG
jgi:hypothetical protein